MTNQSVIAIFFSFSQHIQKCFVTAHLKGKLSLGTGHVTTKRKNICIYNDAIGLYPTKARNCGSGSYFSPSSTMKKVWTLVAFVETSFLVSGKRRTSECLMVLLFLYQLCHAGIDIKHFTCPWSDFVTWLSSLLWISSYTHILSCACFHIVGVVNQHFTRDICEIFLGILF